MNRRRFLQAPDGSRIGASSLPGELAREAEVFHEDRIRRDAQWYAQASCHCIECRPQRTQFTRDTCIATAKRQGFTAGVEYALRRARLHGLLLAAAPASVKADLTQRGRWEWSEGIVYGEPDHSAMNPEPDSVALRSRQDCEDLIALLERVKERLPDGK